jgi:hypothetical protein
MKEENEESERTRQNLANDKNISYNYEEKWSLNFVKNMKKKVNLLETLVIVLVLIDFFFFVGSDLKVSLSSNLKLEWNDDFQKTK